MLPREKPTSHGKGLSSDSGNAVATTFPVRDTLGLTERTEKARPSRPISISLTGEDVVSGTGEDAVSG